MKPPRNAITGHVAFLSYLATIAVAVLVYVQFITGRMTLHSPQQPSVSPGVSKNANPPPPSGTSPGPTKVPQPSKEPGSGTTIIINMPGNDSNGGDHSRGRHRTNEGNRPPIPPQPPRHPEHPVLPKPTEPIVVVNTQVDSSLAPGQLQSKDAVFSSAMTSRVLACGVKVGSNGSAGANRYLLSVKGQPAIHTVMDGIYSATVTISATLSDPSGNVIASATATSDPQASSLENEAYEDACNSAADALFNQLTPRLQAIGQNK